ncbi:hypothetical protein Tco_0652687 [Tanacetum coccineum]|uniref:Uncharacterized protein n=1 Tax=Tanacetum coccineum TaxID=301880 RepID=A0ABQ4WYL1_9ASTR
MEKCHNFSTDQVDDAIPVHVQQATSIVGWNQDHLVSDHSGLKRSKYVIAAMYVSLIWWFQDNYSTLTDSSSEGTDSKPLNHLSPEDKKILTTAGQPMDQKLGYQTPHDNEVQSNTQVASDGTLQQIDEALDYRVKEFQINRTNPGMNTRFWMKKDVDRALTSCSAIR